MNSFIFLAAFFFWGLFWIEGLRLRLICAMMGALFLFFRFRKHPACPAFCLIWILLSAFVTSPLFFDWEAEPGVYVVTDIRESYAIAAMEDSDIKVVVYNPDSLVYGDRIFFEDFEEIHSLKNPGVFSFEESMKRKNVRYSTDYQNGNLVSSGASIRSRIYRFLHRRFFKEGSEEKWSLCRMFLYSIPLSESAEWVVSMGLPILGFSGILRRFLKRRFEGSAVNLVLLLVYLAYGTLFVWSTALLRIFVFTFMRWLLPDKRNLQLPCSILLFLLLDPGGYASFAFVLPVLMALLDKASKRAGSFLIKKGAPVGLLLFLQAVWFGKISLLTFFGYKTLRKLFGFLFLAACLAIVLPDTGLAGLILSLLKSDLPALDSLIFYGCPSIFCVAFFTGAFLYGLFYPGKRSGLLLGFSVLFYFASFSLDPFFHIYQLDIGQGDCAVIVEPFQKSVIMIDAAGNTMRNNAEKIILPFLQAHHIDRLDALIVTHDDFDHSGSVDELLSSPGLEIKTVIRTHQEQVPVDYPFYSLLADRESDVPDTFDSSGLPQSEGQDANDMSIVSWFSYDSFSFLWTGDASSAIEKRVVEEYDLEVDVLKAGHHGSKTSSSPEFLRDISPELAIISAGRNNRYHHPHLETLQNLERAGCDVLSTARDGATSLSVFKNVMFVKTESGLVSMLVK